MKEFIAGIGIGILLTNAVHVWLWLKMKNEPQKHVLFDGRRDTE